MPFGFQAANVPVDFETFFFSEINPVLSSKLEDVAASIRKNKICLKVRNRKTSTDGGVNGNSLLFVTFSTFRAF